MVAAVMRSVKRWGSISLSGGRAAYNENSHEARKHSLFQRPHVANVLLRHHGLPAPQVAFTLGLGLQPRMINYLKIGCLVTVGCTGTVCWESFTNSDFERVTPSVGTEAYCI